MLYIFVKILNNVLKIGPLSGTGGAERDWWCRVGLVAQSVMSATDTLGHLGHQDVCCFVTDPCQRQWICIRTMSKDIGMLS